MREKEREVVQVNTREKLIQAKEKGITLKMIAQITDINVSTLYSYNCGKSNLSKEKEEKVNKALEIFQGSALC